MKKIRKVLSVFEQLRVVYSSEGEDLELFSAVLRRIGGRIRADIYRQSFNKIGP